MGMPVKVIDANYKASTIDENVKVSAGPGAGKTRWLIEHIRNVLYHSKRLHKCRKIACITYTNVGTETILSRLGNTAERVEVSTIHSFLYKHVVKPYVHLVAQNYELDYMKVDGHDDIVITSFGFIDEWKTATGQQRIKADQHDLIVAAWTDLRWRFNASNELVILPEYPRSVGGYNIKNNSYMVYKTMMWRKGLLHHDDVLFFSWQLIKRFPFLLKVLRAKFPYFFVDEFQDTNPIQVKLLQVIAAEETIIAIIGDKAQSIYKFQGADPTQFDAFQLPSLQEYRIDNNHRSTENIVKVLNEIRKDIQQVSERRVTGNSMKVLVGDKKKAVEKAKTMINQEPLYCLCRGNITTNLLRKEIDGNAAKTDLLDELHAKDSNKDRKHAVISFIKSVEFARQGYFKDAIKELKYFPGTRDHTLLGSRKKCLSLLKQFLDDLPQLENGSLFALVEYLNKGGVIVPTFRAGAIKDFYNATSYKHVSAAVKSLDESGLFRTIHKAKGDEFDNVILVIDTDESGQFDEAKELKFLLHPDLNGNEEHRIKYVGLSRARNNLFLSIPLLSSSNKAVLEAKGIEVIDLSPSTTTQIA
jgi:DNA helicase-2/ATP-dependent DNA helicase PcrA